MPHQESGLYTLRKPHILLRRLAFILSEEGSLPWLNYSSVMTELERKKSPGRRDYKPAIIGNEIDFVNASMEKRLDYFETVLSVRNWWERVVDVPRRRIYLITPMVSKPRTREESDDVLSYFYKDPLAPTMRNTYVLKDFLERKGVASDIYHVSLDHLYLPFLTMPDRDIERQALPEDLQELYHRHVASYEVYNPQETIQRLRRSKWLKEKEGLKYITADEKLADDPLLSEDFKKYMQHCVHIVQVMHYLQLREFFSRQITPESIVMVYGLNMHLEPFNIMKQLFNEKIGVTEYYPNPDIVGIRPEEGRSLCVNPLDGVTDHAVTEKIRKNGLADERSLKSLEAALDYLLKVNS